MNRKFRPTESDGNIIDIKMARERKNIIAQEKKRIMNRLLTLSEEEIAKVNDLNRFTEEKFDRRIFVEKEESHLHVADRIDRIVDWLNKGDEERLEELKESGNTPETLRADLYAIAEQFFTFANELNDLKKIQFDLAAWKQKYDNLIEELYQTVQLMVSAKYPIKEHRSPSWLSTEIRIARINLIKAVREAFDIDTEEWMEYVNNNT